MTLVGPDEVAGVLLPEGKLQVPDAAAMRRAVLDRLRSEIRLGVLPGGTRLRQAQLAERLGVSRMPVRDAISDLVAEGLAVGRPGGGAFVTELSREDMYNVYAVRAALEVPGVIWACEGDNVEQLVTDLRAILDDAEPHVANGRLEQLTELDKAFHWTIYRATNNRFVETAMAPMWAQVDRIMYAVLKLPDYVPMAWREHAAIVEAIAAGDAEQAAHLMQVHVTQAADRLIR